VKENPRLVRDSLLYVAPLIREGLQGAGPIDERVTALLEGQRGFPVELSESRFTTVDTAAPEGLDDALDSLVTRIVRPRRHGGGGGHNPRLEVEKRLRPLLAKGRVECHHFFKSSGTGTQRAVDFYANSGVNTALDVVRLAIRAADQIQSRADAEAACKVYDIQRENDIRFVVYCDFSLDRNLEEANATAQRVIESTGAVVVTDADRAASAIISG
jgi:hypothetical protein